MPNFDRSIAKISRPRTKGVLPRPRVFELLDSARSHPIIWISAPGGSGKTTLVASYLTEKNHDSTLWYQIDERDNDLGTFFYYMGLAGKKAAPRKKTPLPLLTPEYAFGIPDFTLRYFEDLYSRLARPSLVVFDNYQTIPETSDFHDRICQGLSILSDGINVVILSRQRPPPHFARLKANNQMAFIDAEAINFTAEESRDFVSLEHPEASSGDLHLRLYERTRGWAAGLVLLLETAVTKGERWVNVSLSSSDDISHYFATEIFGKMDTDTRIVLLKTAFLPTMTAAMAQDLTGDPRSVDVLSRLARDNFFTQRGVQPEPAYQYHPLFREFLLDRATALMTQEEIQNLRRTAAYILERSGRVEDAADLLRAANDLLALKQLILTYAPVLLSQGRAKTVENMLSAFSTEIVDREPWLLYWFGICTMTHNLISARLHLSHAFELFEAGNDIVGTLVAWSGVVDTIVSTWDISAPLDVWIEWLERRMQTDPTFPSSQVEARVASSMSGALLWKHPYRPDVESWLNRALAISTEIGDVNLSLKNRTWAAVYFGWRADLVRTRIIVDEVERLASAHSVSPLASIASVILRAGYTELTGSMSSLQAIIDTIRFAQSRGVRAMDYPLLVQGVYGAFSTGDLERAEEFLRQMGAFVESGNSSSIAQYHWMAGWYHVIRGETAQSGLHVERAMAFEEGWKGTFPEIGMRHLRAHVYHKRGDYDESLRDLATASRLAKGGGFMHFDYVLSLTEAEFALDQGDESAAVESLRAAMPLGRTQGIKSMMLVWRPSVMARLCAKALEHDIEVDYVRSLIRTFGLLPPDGFDKLPHWPWPVEVRTLGRFEVLTDGKPIEFSRKVQKKPLDMLKALIAFGGKEVREEIITDALWPDAAGDDGHHAFEVTLKRLRTLLGHPETLPLHDGRLSLDARYCNIDTWFFEDLLERRDGMLVAADRMKKAMDLYRGGFLVGEKDEHWVLPLRERLRDRFMRSVGSLAMDLEESGRWRDALGWYQEGLEVDDLAEQLYQGLMRCHFRLGQKGEALSAYQRCRRTLSLVLGVTPSTGTQELYEAIRATN